LPTEQQPPKRPRDFGGIAAGFSGSAGGNLCLGLVKHLDVDDGWMDSGTDRVAIADQAGVDRIGQRCQDLARRPAAAGFCSPASVVGDGRDLGRGLALGGPPKHLSNAACFARRQDELLRRWVCPVTIRHNASDAPTLALERSAGVGESLPRHLPLEFGERRQDVESEGVLSRQAQFWRSDD
jgi:hypothetical protein